MAEVVGQLKECLELESHRDRRQRRLGSSGKRLTCPGEGTALWVEEERSGDTVGC